MTHDILSVKLYELDKAIGQMHSRIEQGEMDCPEQVEKDIQELRRECRGIGPIAVACPRRSTNL